MKKLLYLLLVFCSFSSYKCQDKKSSDFIKTLGNGYYSIPNKVGNQLILSNYQNYKNNNDSIFLEKILYLYEKDNFILVIGNIMGSKTSLVLALEKNKEKFEYVYSEQVALIDTVEKEIIKDYTFLKLNNIYSDICSEREVLLIYILDNLRFYKSFEGIKSEEFNNTGDSLCQRGVSYIQNFDLKFENNEIVLNAHKKGTDKKSEFKKYYFKNHQFK